MKKLEAVQKLQDKAGSKTRSRTQEVEEYKCMPYMQLRLLELFRPSCDGREQGSRQEDPRKEFETRRRSKDGRPKIQRVKNRVVEYNVGRWRQLDESESVYSWIRTKTGSRDWKDGRDWESWRVSRSGSQNRICDERGGLARRGGFSRAELGVVQVLREHTTKRLQPIYAE